MRYLNYQTLKEYMSLGYLSKELEELLNAKIFQNRICKEQLILKELDLEWSKNCPAIVTQK